MATAFVLSGGGSLGAVQVGMLRALVTRGVQADFVAGASVSALNGAYFAACPNERGVEELARLWLAIGRHDVFPLRPNQVLHALTEDLPLHPLRAVVRALGVANYTFRIDPMSIVEAIVGRHNYLFPNDQFRRLQTADTGLAESPGPVAGAPVRRRLIAHGAPTSTIGGRWIGVPLAASRGRYVSQPSGCGLFSTAFHRKIPCPYRVRSPGEQGGRCPRDFRGRFLRVGCVQVGGVAGRDLIPEVIA